MILFSFGFFFLFSGVKFECFRCNFDFVCIFYELVGVVNFFVDVCVGVVKEFVFEEIVLIGVFVNVCIEKFVF